MSVIDLDYGAITIDTCIFENLGIALESGLFNQLDQFKNSPVKVIISEIVDKELNCHLQEKIKIARNKIDQALKGATKQLLITEKRISDAKQLIYGKGTEKDISNRRLRDFYKKIDAEIVKCDNKINITNLVKMYFACEAPFENDKNKRKEFPDALALMSLELWAEKKDVKILAVSADKGWIKYGEKSDNIDVIDHLGHAISHFQPHIKSKNIVYAIQRDYVEHLKGNQSYIYDQIKNAIIDSIDGIWIDVDAQSSYAYERDEVYAEFIEYDLDVDQNDYPEINIIRIEPESLVIQVTANVRCEINASFQLYVWDSVDKEHMSIGSSYECKYEDYTTDVLIYFIGNIAEGFDSVQIDEIEISETPTYAHFGELEPDWSD